MILTLLQAVQEAAPVAASKSELFYAAGAVVLGQVTQLLAAHLKGVKGDRRANTTMNRIEKKLDVFIETQVAVNHDHDMRIRETSAHVIGPDGENGLRSRVRALEELQRPSDVGVYAPPRRV